MGGWLVFLLRRRCTYIPNCSVFSRYNIEYGPHASVWRWTCCCTPVAPVFGKSAGLSGGGCVVRWVGGGRFVRGWMLLCLWRWSGYFLYCSSTVFTRPNQPVLATVQVRTNASVCCCTAVAYGGWVGWWVDRFFWVGRWVCRRMRWWCCFDKMGRGVVLMRLCCGGWTWRHMKSLGVRSVKPRRQRAVHGLSLINTQNQTREKGYWTWSDTSVSDCEPSLSPAIVTARYCWRCHPEICYMVRALERGLRETRLVFAGSCCNKQTGGISLKVHTEGKRTRSGKRVGTRDWRLGYVRLK